MTQQTRAFGLVPRPVRRRLIPALALLAATAPLAAAQLPDVDGPPGRVARISAANGAVSLQASGDTNWSIAPLNYSLTTGDRLFADTRSRAELEVGAFTLRIGDGTDLTITNLTDGLAQFGIAQGTLRLTVYRLDFGDTLEIDTPNGAVTVRDPGHYRVEVPANAGHTLVSVDDGGVDIEGPGLGQTLRGHQTVRLDGFSPVDLAATNAPPFTPFDAWSADRDADYRAADCSRYMSAEIPGCADLQRYGRWEHTRQYGFVWYPPPGIPGWTPYRMGHWVWVEPWGWVWVDAEPWGFAPSHYGRWATLGGAWVWVPGPIVRPVYSPALVAFVGDGRLGVGIQAWFPLGPRDPFIPWYHYGPRYLRRVNAANVRGVTNINIFVSVTDVSRIRYAHRDYGLTAVSRETFRDGHRVDGATVRVRGSDGRVQPHPPVMPTGRAASGGTPGRTAQPRPGTPHPIIVKRPPPPQTPPFSDRAKVMKSNPGRPLDPQQMEKLRKAKPAPKSAPARGEPRKASPPGKGSTGKATPSKAKPKTGRGGGGGGGGGNGG